MSQQAVLGTAEANADTISGPFVFASSNLVGHMIRPVSSLSSGCLIPLCIHWQIYVSHLSFSMPTLRLHNAWRYILTCYLYFQLFFFIFCFCCRLCCNEPHLYKCQIFFSTELLCACSVQPCSFRNVWLYAKLNATCSSCTQSVDA